MAHPCGAWGRGPVDRTYELVQASHGTTKLIGLAYEVAVWGTDRHDATPVSYDLLKSISSSFGMTSHGEQRFGILKPPSSDVKDAASVVEASGEWFQYAADVVHGDARAACLDHRGDSVEGNRECRPARRIGQGRAGIGSSRSWAAGLCPRLRAS